MEGKEAIRLRVWEDTAGVSEVWLGGAEERKGRGKGMQFYFS